MPLGKHWTYDEVVSAAEPSPGSVEGDDWKYTILELGKFDTAPNPASTKRVIYGPCKVRYQIHKSGVRATVL